MQMKSELALPCIGWPRPDAIIRAFDLGGSGLKTQLYRVISVPQPGNQSMFDVAAVPGTRQNLGRCPVDVHVRDWLHSLDMFNADAYGLSLAGLDKLFEAPLSAVDEHAEMQALVADMHGHRSCIVARLDDGQAHLLAGIYGLRLFDCHPILCVAAGTGVAVGMTNSKGELRQNSEVRAWAQDRESWQMPVPVGDTRQPLYKALGMNFNQQIPMHDLKWKWRSFLETTALGLYAPLKLSLPKTIVISGGVIDGCGYHVIPHIVHHDGTAVPVLKGPHDAGLYGAAVSALLSCRWPTSGLPSQP